MNRTLVLVAVATTTVTALAADPKNPKLKRTPAVTVTATAPAAQVAVVAPAPAAPAVAVAVVAEPEPAADRPGFSAGGLLGLSSTGFGFGLGARAGYTFPFHLYLGGAIGDFFGGAGHVFTLAPEVGYDLALPAGGLPFLLRPYVGLGYANYDNLTAGGAFVVYPGVEFLYDVLPSFFVGVDVRVPLLTAGQATAIFNGFLTAGYRM